MIKETDAIDVVITWVDGNDPIHHQKMLPYLSCFTGDAPEDLAGPTRFRSVGEIRYCVASILRFAPFIRTIYIVTDGQDPKVNDLLPLYFPHSTTTIELIDHTLLFAGLEGVLPVFNSLSIESCIFRIPTLSERFVYFNDDLFLIRPVTPTDWFVQEKPVVYGSWRSVPFDSLLRLLKPKRHGIKPFGFKDSMLNAAQQIGSTKRYYCIDHTPHALRKSVLKNYFESHPEVLMTNIQHRFRDHSQFNPQALHALLANNRNILVPGAKGRLLYMKPAGRKNNYVGKKLKQADNHQDTLFACIGSLDLASPADCKHIIEWLAAKIGVGAQPIIEIEQ